MATYAGRLRDASPIPRGWLPKLGKKKKQYPILLAAEDAALLGLSSIPLNRRLTYGILHREGLRRGDLEALRWRQLDLEHGMRIESDKTNHQLVVHEEGLEPPHLAVPEPKSEHLAERM